MLKLVVPRVLLLLLGLVLPGELSFRVLEGGVCVDDFELTLKPPKKSSLNADGEGFGFWFAGESNDKPPFEFVCELRLRELEALCGFTSRELDVLVDFAGSSSSANKSSSSSSSSFHPQPLLLDVLVVVTVAFGFWVLGFSGVDTTVVDVLSLFATATASSVPLL